MNRYFLSIVVGFAVAVGFAQAQDPPLPQTLSYVDVAYAKASVGADGKAVFTVHMLGSQSVSEVRAVTKNVTETRVVDGKPVTVLVPRTETVTVAVSKPKWNVVRVPLAEPSVKFHDVAGNAIDTATAALRLANSTPILLGTQAPDRFFLQGAKADMLVMTVAADILYAEDVRDVPKAVPPLPQLPLTLPVPPPPLLPKTNSTETPQPEKTPSTNPPVAQDNDVPVGAPPIAVVKSMLEIQWGPLGQSTKHVYNFKSIKFGPPTKEVLTVNGQGVFTGKVRYPVRVVCDIRVNFNDGTSRMETKNQTFHFFRDEFMEWSFRFMQNN